MGALPSTMPTADLQRDRAGRLVHLLDLAGLTAAEITALLDAAEGWLGSPDATPARSEQLAGLCVANLFFEPSTRTRASFELAARRLGADVLNLDLGTSSQQKGETLLDTIHTLEAMRVAAFVIRSGEPGTLAQVASHVAPGVHVINAGEAHLSHPTQGLLDLLTIRRHKPDIGALTVVIAGDVAHSRVARSAASALTSLGVGELRLVAPPSLLPAADEFPGAQLSSDLDAALDGADVVMMLRIQRERFAAGEAPPDADAYLARYGLTTARMSLARPDALVMHPGPMNRDVEIASAVADGPNSVIREQVTNGVAARMAVLEALLSESAA